MKKITLGIMTASCLLFNLPAQAQNEAPYTYNFSQALVVASSHDQDLQAAEFAYQSSSDLA